VYCLLFLTCCPFYVEMGLTGSPSRKRGNSTAILASFNTRPSMSDALAEYESKSDGQSE